MDPSWLFAELATPVTGSEFVRLPRVCGYMKATVYAHKVSRRDELLGRILGAVRRINNAAVLRKFTRSLVTRVGKCIQEGEGHFDQLAWAVKYVTVTVQLTAVFNKHAIYFFLFYFIQFTVNSRVSVIVANRTHVYMTFLTQNYLWN
jgi:hypothetical protein